MTQTPFPQTTPESLDLALDAFADGDSTPLDTLDPGTAATWSLLQEWTLRGGLDSLELQEPSPEPLATNHPAEWTHRTPSKGMHLMEQAPALHPVAPPTTTQPRRLSGMFLNAVAWLVIVALAGGAVWGGGPGKSWVLSEDDPLIGDAAILGGISDTTVEVVGPPLIVGDTVIVTVSAPSVDGSPYLTIRYDMEKREVMWVSSQPLFGHLATDGTYVYGIGSQPSLNTGEEVYAPQSLELGTGHLHMWIEPYSVYEPYSGSPISTGDGTYIADTMGHVVLMMEDQLYTAQFGQYPDLPFGSSSIALDGFGEHMLSSSIVMTGDYLYAVRPSHTVVQYNRFTGEEIGSINLVDLLRGDVDRADLQVFDNKLVAIAYRPTPEGSDARPASIAVLDADTLAPRTRTDILDLRSNLVVTPDWIYLAGRAHENEPVHIYALHPVGGTLGAPISGVEFANDATIGLSLAGNVLMTVDTSNGVAFENVVTQEHLWQGTLDGDNNVIDGGLPMQLWGDRPVVITQDGTIVVFGEAPEG